MKILALPIVAVALAGCATKPVVSGFNGDSVTVQSSNNGSDPEVLGQAMGICRSVGRDAIYASSRQIYAPQNLLPTFDHLFLCLPPGTAPSSAPTVTAVPAAAQPGPSATMAPLPTQTTRLPGHRVVGRGCPGFEARPLYAESPEQLPLGCRGVETL